MKFFLLIALVLLFNACHFFEEEPEVLLSTIDGEEYYAVKTGQMNARKAALYILDGLKDSVSFEAKLDLMDSLETQDEVWEDRYLQSFNLVLDEVYAGDNKKLVEDRVFAFLIHRPKTLLNHLNNEGFNSIDTWMEVLSNGLIKAIEPSDITVNSVANAVISNCKECSEKEQQLIVELIFKLEMVGN